MNNGKIQFVDLVAQYQQIKPEVDAAMAKVCARGDFIMGEDVKLFEQEFAAFCKVPHCVAVANGTEALQMALLACGVGPGDEVITCTHTFIATVVAIHQAGAKPVLVDCDPRYYTIDTARWSAPSPRAPRRSSRCTSTANRRTWTRSWRWRASTSST
jgi:dTDP-4-amino-4,6-dideoxygalactose transaminase